MTVERNKTLIMHFYEEFFNKGNFAVVDQMHAPNYIYHDLADPKRIIDNEGYKKRNQVFAQAFPDRVVHIEEMIAEGDKIVVRSTMYAIQSGPLSNIPNTGKEIKLAAMIIYRFAEDKIAEEWELWDALGLYQQLGVDPFKI